MTKHEGAMRTMRLLRGWMLGNAALAMLLGVSGCQVMPWMAGADGEADASAAAPAKVDEKYIWDLTALYPDAEAWSREHAALGERIEALGRFKGTLGRSSKAMRTALDEISAVQKDVVRLLVYAVLKSDEDTRIAENQERRQLSRAMYADFGAAVSYVRPELLALGSAKVRRFLRADPGLAHHRFSVEQILRNEPHTRSAEVEEVLALASRTASAPRSIRDLLALSDIDWPEIELSTGESLQVNAAGYARGRQLPDRDDRKRTFEAFWGTWKDYESSFGGALDAQVQNLRFVTRARRFDNSLQRSLFAENMPEAVYRTLVAEANAALPTLHRYFRLRKRMLGISDKLGYHDIYPPLVELDKKFPIEETIALTRRALEPLGPEYLEVYDLGVRSRWMHVYPQPGKASGAYMFGSAYDVHPYVLLNHLDDYNSASTFAHEYGHAVHTVLASRNQPWENSNYATFIAETASIMNSMLLGDLVKSEAQTSQEQLYYLGISLDALRGTFFRQTMFAEFELAINEAVDAGQAMTGEKMSAIYLELLRRYHGHEQGVMDIDELYGIEWAYIPHFYRDFYVYQYATSIAAAAGLAEKIASGDSAARDAFINMLKAGGSDYAYELMKSTGVDLATPGPYRALVTRMNETMDQMEALLDAGG